MTGTANPGSGLLPARTARPIRSGERIHVVGAAGAGASAAVLHAAWAGAAVDGCDPGGPTSYTSPIEALGVPLAWEHDAVHVTRSPAPERLAVTKALTAIAPDHPELTAARAAGIAIEPWQQVIADAAAGRRLVGVAGTHGKSTTAGWLVHVLVEAGLDPSAFVGALLPASLTGGIGPATARRGTGDAFVVEADEYAGNFDPYRPDVVLLTSIEWDHPDVFADRSAVAAAFEAWLRAVPDATLVANLGDAGVDELVRRLADRPGPVIAVQVEVQQEARDRTNPQRAIAVTPRPIRGSEIDRYVSGTAWVDRPDRTNLWLVDHATDAHLVDTTVQLVGAHNAANAAVVAGGALALGVHPDAIASGLTSFGGVGRRLERLGETAGVVVYDDYGHHPTAIRVTLDAVRQREPGRRIWAVYEPLTYHRTAAMLEAFADALMTADAVAIADIWAGRDPDTTVTSAAALAGAVAHRNPTIPAAAPGSVEATAAWLAGEVRAGDAVLVMGGGKSSLIGRLLLEALADR
ncbi:MAG TPA: cyanophycin synthetase [Candidatus Limnocylindrales bacterium]|nr:cyanophycin synthetase [Candidatus Limnocylindrales bacterium]